MLLVYTHTITPRLSYILDFIGHELFTEPLTLTCDAAAFEIANGPRLNYSATRLSEEEFHLAPVNLLFEQNIYEQSIHCFEIGRYMAFFKTEGDFSFDLLAASFYLLSRYEEYLPHQTDMYGRYAHTNSLAYREGFLQQPLINIWLDMFKTVLARKFPGLQFRKRQFKCVLSYDIDMAYSYKHKGWWRNAGGFIRDSMQGRWHDVKERWLVLSGKEKDPYDCFEWLDALHLYCRLRPYYFFLVAKRTGQYDKNISTRVKAFRQLIEYYANTNYKTGLHPSWQSGDDAALLKEEKEWLQVVADKDIIRSRQHYLRFTLPYTYRTLMAAGIEKEYSMGYGTINGFRASVCSSFYWYDLEREEQTSLLLYPFCFMDGNAYYEQKSSPQEAYQELTGYYNMIRQLNGLYISIWHNSTLGTSREFADWRRVFELFMRETVYWEAYCD